jgi:metabolite-proton symporter
MLRVVTAGAIGTTLQWYDFFLYSFAAALVFDKLFFPNFEPLTGIMLGFATFGVGFVARPLGGLVLGHFGDRIGRKKILVFSVVLMGAATVGLGLLPTYATIGVAAPILLVVLRLVQGFAVGGEWGGAALMISEHASAKHRGFWASWTEAGASLAAVLVTALMAILTAGMSTEAFFAWGWRMPFLLSSVLVVIGLWMRTSISESPVFQAAAAAAEAPTLERMPLIDVVRNQWRQLLIAMGAKTGENLSYYAIAVFILAYLTQHLGLPQEVGLNAVLIGSVVDFALIPLWGALSDRIGRRPVMLFGALGMAVWISFFFLLIDTRSSLFIILATTVAMVFHSAMTAPRSAFFSELFDTRVRYSGASIGYQMASIYAGGPAPLVTTALLVTFGVFTPIAIYIALGAVITAVATIASKETRRRELSEAPMDLESPVGGYVSGRRPAV